MNINDIKHEIATKNGTTISKFNLVRQKELDGTTAPWLSHWDNEKRIRVTFPAEVAEKIKLDMKRDDLAYKYELVPEAEVEHEGEIVTRAAYKRYIVIIPTSIEMVF